MPKPLECIVSGRCLYERVPGRSVYLVTIPPKPIPDLLAWIYRHESLPIIQTITEKGPT